MNSQQWKAAHPSPKAHMHSSSMNEAINPSSNPSSGGPSSSSVGAVLRNSTFKLSNVNVNVNGGAPSQRTDSHSRDSPEQESSSSSKTSANANANSYQQYKNKNPSTQTSSTTTEKEVDYYHNPTELFRWINYRRWDGARARVHSNPEECAIWVVSRHSTDGRVLWRQLPLHLVSMQCGIKFGEEHDFHNDENRDVDDSTHGHGHGHGQHTHGNGKSMGGAPPSAAEEMARHNVHLQQVEQLLEDLLEAHPEAASLQDDQGMLPLHTCLNSINPDKNLGPNERVLSLLLLANAPAVQVRDHYGRTPADIIKAKMKIAHGSAAVPRIETALRLVRRAEAMNQNIKESMANEAEKKLIKVAQHADNERQASQRIIRRLEQELAEEQNRAQREVHSAGEMEQTSNILYEELRMVKQDYATTELDLDQARKERDDLVAKNERLRNEMDKQDEIVAGIKSEAEKKVEEQAQVVASLKSEVNTARAMAEGMESQLRSKFSNEEELRSSVTQVRKEMSTLASQSKREKKKFLEDIDRLEDELKHAKTFAEEMEKKNETLDQRNADLDKHLGQVLVAYNSLSSEYDQLFDSTNRHETSMMESIRVERNNIAAALEKQKKMFEASIAEQEQLMTQASKKESVLRDMFAQAKKREIEAVGKIKEDFQAIRTRLSTKHCMVTEPGIKQATIFPIETTTCTSEQEIQHSSTQHENFLKENIHVHVRGVHVPEKDNSMNLNESTFSSGSNVKTRERDHETALKSPILATKSEPPVVVEVQNNANADAFKSPGLLSLLEERAQYSARRSHNASDPRRSQNIDTLPSMSASFHPSSANKQGQRRPSPGLPLEAAAYSTMSSLHPSSSSKMQHSVARKSAMRSPVMTFTDGQKYSATPNNSKEVMRQWPVSGYVGDTSDSTTAGYTASQNSFSLDEFSDVDSRVSSGVSTFGDQRNHYRGMRNAVKQDLIRVSNAAKGSNEMRDRYVVKEC